MKHQMVTIACERRFTITINGVKHGGFVRESEWNGLTAFKAPDGSKVIVHRDPDFSQMLARLMGEDEEITATIVLASPSFLNDIPPGHTPESHES